MVSSSRKLFRRYRLAKQPSGNINDFNSPHRPLGQFNRSLAQGGAVRGKAIRTGDPMQKRPKSHRSKTAEMFQSEEPKGPTDSLTFRWWKSRYRESRIEPNPFTRRLLQIACNFCRRLRVGIDSQPEDSVLGSGSTEVGKGPTRKPGRPTVELSAGPDAFPKLRIDGDGSLRTTRVCGAMSQQNSDSGSVSAPQKFVHLVGCRDPKARTRPWVRPRPPPQQQ